MAWLPFVRGYRWLMLQLVCCWRDPAASPELAAFYRGRQFRAVVRQLPLCSLANLITVGVIATVFRDQARDRVWVICAGLLAAAQVVNMVVWWRCRSMGSAYPVSIRAIWLLAARIGFAALAFAWMTVDLFGLTDEHGRLILTAVVAAFIATGSWMFASLPHTGLAWALTLCGATAAGLWAFHWNTYALLVGLLVFYGAVLSGAVLMTSHMFIRRQMAETEIDRQRQLVRLLLHDFEENASDWLWETDRQGCLLHVSMRLADVLGVPPDRLQGRNLVSVLAAMFTQPDADEWASLQHLAACLAQEAPFRDAVVAVRGKGHTRWWSLTAKPLLDASSRIVGWRGVGSDITALRERDMEMKRLANEDSLTGLANRHRFGELLASYFSNPQAISSCTLLLLDLDNFKTVNDSLGHSAGDVLLRETADRLSGAIAQDGLLARLGGDEFALIVPGRLTRDAVESLGARLQAAVARPLMVNDHHIEVHASIGVAFGPDDARNAEELLRVSDMALYEAKASGRHALRLFSAEMEVVARRKMDMLSDLREGLQRGDFHVVYQPQIDLSNHMVVGVEALMRWRHPVHGMISPADFIPIAEDGGLIVQLGSWILEQACKDAARWPASIRVAVNVSAAQFERSNLIEVVSHALSVSGLPCNRLELELTESTLMRDSAVISTILKALRQTGVRIALDDFGTGYSSLSYLRHFPLDKLKIDRSFVRSLDEPDRDGSSVSIVQTIVDLAHALRLDTTAEGVETLAQRDILRNLGCIYAQGFLYAKPMDADQALAFIQRSNQPLVEPAVALAG